MKYVPHPYQRRAADHGHKHKRSALHMDLGTGKTTTAMLLGSELLDSFDVRGVMVFAPLRVATVAWPEEFAKWDCFAHLDYTVVRGNEDARVRHLTEEHQFYILNYDLMSWWVEWIAARVKARKSMPFDMLILDESSRLKSPSSSRFKCLKPVADSTLFPRIVELTGTPAPENYEDLWSQYRLLDGGARLEPYVTHFRNTYYDQNPYNRYELKLKPGAAAIIDKKISDITVSINAEEHLAMPKLIENVISVELKPNERAIYKQFEDDMVAQINDETIVAPSAAIVSEKCRQVASGAVYAEDKTYRRIHTAKFDALDELIEDNHLNFLVAFWYKHELETIQKRYPKAGVLASGVSDKEALRMVRAWNARELSLLFMHPASVGHGINLQHGGHHLVWLTIPWSNELYRQTVGRIYRQGQTQSVTVHRILAKNTVDVLVESAIKAKEFTQASLRSAIAKLNKETA